MNFTMYFLTSSWLPIHKSSPFLHFCHLMEGSSYYSAPSLSPVLVS